MTITLSGKLEEQVKTRMLQHGLPSPEQVVELAMRHWETDDAASGIDPAWLEAELLKGVRSPSSPWRGREEVAEIMAELYARHGGG